jgi:hypothetical protein
MNPTNKPCDKLREMFGPIIPFNPPLDTTLLKAFGIRGIKKDLWYHLDGVPGEYNAKCMRYWVNDESKQLGPLPFRYRLDRLAFTLEDILVGADYPVPDKDARDQVIEEAKANCLSATPEIQRADVIEHDEKVDLIIDVLRARTCVTHHDLRLLLQRNLPEVEEAARFDAWIRTIAEGYRDLPTRMLADALQDRLEHEIRLMPPRDAWRDQARGRSSPFMRRRH